MLEPVLVSEITVVINPLPVVDVSELVIVLFRLPLVLAIIVVAEFWLLLDSFTLKIPKPNKIAKVTTIATKNKRARIASRIKSLCLPK